MYLSAPACVSCSTSVLAPSANDGPPDCIRPMGSIFTSDRVRRPVHADGSPHSFRRVGRRRQGIASGRRTAGCLTMAQSAETENVHVAARFGWNLAMLRGRLRDGPPAEAPVAIHRTDHALPLGVERSWSEQTIQAEAVVKGLAQPTGLAIDLTLAELSYQEEDPKTVATNRLEDLAKALAAARKSGVAADVETAWNAVASFMASWDSKIQDHLAHRALVSAGYQ